MSVKVEMLDLPYVRAILFAAVDLLTEVELGDEALLPDSVVESARGLREALERQSPSA